MTNDNRPRIMYRLPDGTHASIIFDHGDRIPFQISFGLKDGRTTWLPIVNQNLIGKLAGEI